MPGALYLRNRKAALTALDQRRIRANAIADAAEALVPELARDREDVRILVNGPWPPYNFADVVTGA
jgi:hypothetical protein